MINKGALTNILDICSFAETIDGKTIGIVSIQDQIQKHFTEFSLKGFRTLGIAYKSLPSESIITINNEMVDHPRRWNIKAIRKFMITFGLVSSVFDFLTFGLLLLVLHANEGQFRTAWFLESVISASMIVLVFRSSLPCLPGRHATGRHHSFKIKIIL